MLQRKAEVLAEVVVFKITLEINPYIAYASIQMSPLVNYKS